MTRKAPSTFLALALACHLLSSSGCGSEYAQVTEGAISVDRAEIVFAPTLVGRTSNVQLTIRNSGDGDLLIQDIEITNSSPYIRFSDGFVIQMASAHDWFVAQGAQHWTENPSFTLAPAEQLQIDLIFAPRDTNANCPGGDNEACGSVVITSNSRNQDILSVGLGLAQSAGLIAVEPTVLRFPDTTGGPYTQDFTITNQGAGPLRISNISDPGVTGITFIELSNRAIPYDLSPGSEANYRVTFLPNPATTYCADSAPDDGCILGTLQIDSNDANGTVVTVMLQVGGVGLPRIDVEPRIVTFETAPSETDTAYIDVTNEGGANLGWNVRLDPPSLRSLFAIEVAGTAYSTSGAQMTALSPALTRTIELHFSPESDASIHAEMIITSTDPIEPTVVVHIYGGAPAPEIEIFPTQLFFPVVDPGSTSTMQFTIINIGRVDLEIEEATLSIGAVDYFSLDPELVGMTIPPNSRQTVTVSYHRPVGGGAGIQIGELTIRSNALEPNDAYVVNLFANNGDDALPPTAVIEVTPGEPYAISNTITLSAASSTPPDGGSLVSNPYNWALIDAPSGSTATLSSDYLEVVTLRPDRSGTYTIMLTVTSAISATVTTQGQTTRNLYVAPN